MDDKMSQSTKPSPERLETMKNLPKEIMGSITKEEVSAFLHDEVWPDSLREKLKDFMEDPE